MLVQSNVCSSFPQAQAQNRYLVCQYQGNYRKGIEI